MKSDTSSLAIAGLFLAVTGAFADIPGLFVVQEANLANPQPIAATASDKFGTAGIKWIGDVNNDGIQDLIVGNPNSFNDTGSLVIYTMGPDGKPKGSPYVISPYDSKISQFLDLNWRQSEYFGVGVDVVRALTPTECGVVVTSSLAKTTLWAIRVCKDGAGFKVDSVAAITKSSPIFTGLTTARFGESIQTIDTLGTGERILAIGLPTEGSSTVANAGKVLLVSLNPVNLAFSAVSSFPSTYADPDPVGKNLAVGSDFGRSVVRLGKSGGKVHLAITAYGDKVNGAALGRIHFVDLNSTDYSVASSVPSAVCAGSDTLVKPRSISVADFDHDGILDLVVGNPTKNSGAYTALGGYAVALMKSTSEFKSIKFFQKSPGAIVDTNSVIGDGAYLGMSILAGDFDGNSMADVVIGGKGASATVPGSIWMLRMKSIPWLHRTGDTIPLASNVVSKTISLSDYVTGNALNWAVSEIDVPVTGSISTCSAVRLSISGEPLMDCNSLSSNGNSHWRVTATDNGNYPVSDHFSQSVDFYIKITGKNAPPIRLKNLPDTLFLREDQKDTAAISFSQFYSDPDGTPDKMVYDLTPLNNSTDPLITYYRSGDILHITGIPYHPGICSLQVAATDPVGSKLIDTLVIKMVHVNHAPKAAADNYEIIESTPTDLLVKSNDKDDDVGDVTAISISIAPTRGIATVDAQQGKIIFKPDSFFLGNDSLQYKLSDGQAYSLAWVYLKMTKTLSPARLYKSLPDVKLDEGANAVVLKLDSLFFSGTERFAVQENEAEADNCRQFATITHDRVNFTLTIKPIPYQSGSCLIRISSFADKKLADTMLLNVVSVPNPYKFAKKDSTIEAGIGLETAFALDHADLDRDTLEYRILTDISSAPWITFDGFRVVLKPDEASTPKTLKIEVRKKALPTVDPSLLAPSDTLNLYVIPTVLARVNRRFGTYANLRFSDGNVVFQGGIRDFEVQLTSLQGRVLLSTKAKAGQSVSVKQSRLPKFVYLRLSEGDRIVKMPLFIHE